MIIKTLLAQCLMASVMAAATTNIVLVITDDQGYGDLACNGNPIIKTPNLDKLAGESSGLSDYHVAPTCSPTRCSLLTGHWTNRTGVWHTINGRSMLRANEVTISQMLKDAGYQTGMFGKWHLGDNYPYRPEDRGFTEVYRHGGGGVGQTPDVWDNSYFDGAYFHNGKVVPAKGFCTDVFFEQANAFIEKCASEKKPFFAYIAPNAPHGPLHAPQKYLDLYKGPPPAIAAFYGMITNIDDNVGKTRDLLKKLGIVNDTIFIFTTDNGTASGAQIFNAGMKGNKGSPYDGGHRVPFFIHWPAGGLEKKHDINELTHVADIVPTLLEMTGVNKPEDLEFDGVSIAALLNPSKEVDWPERFVVTDSQRVRDPIKWRQSAVMSKRYRLINGEELYDIIGDPGQERNIAEKNPEIVSSMRDFYDNWWAELEPTFSQTTEIYLGHPDHPEVSLTAHDWIQNSNPPWNQQAIRSVGMKQPKTKKRVHEGHWAVKVMTTGNYRVSLRRWPLESGAAINASLPRGENVPGASRAYRCEPGKAIGATKATLRINDQDLETQDINGSAAEVSFTTRMAVGSHRLAPYFHVKGGELGAYYTIVTKID